MKGHNYSNDPTLEYDVWGGYESQDHAEHYATFATLEEAKDYRREQLAIVGRRDFHLTITPVRKRQAVPSSSDYAGKIIAEAKRQAAQGPMAWGMLAEEEM